VNLWGAITGFFRGSSAHAQTIRVVHDRPVHGSYDLARTTDENRNHWAGADAYNADSANSVAVRQKTVRRSRMETANNGYAKGISLTHANYVVGRGPKLRLQTATPGFNAMVEAMWGRWATRVKLARKLRTAIKAKVIDGEAVLLARFNPALADPVQLDLVGIETEQMTSTDLLFFQKNRVDGIWFDDFGNPTAYDILPYHPGGGWWPVLPAAEKIPAKFVFHFFREDRSGQHRAIPELASTLSTCAQSREFRESVLGSARNLSDFSIFFKTAADPLVGPGQLLPFDTLEIQKGMATALPSGGDAFQPKAEQPAATYEGFLRTQVGEQARPLSMSYALAACDSSNANFASAKLDQHPYFGAIDVDQADAEDLVLDPLFALWFEEAVRIYGWVDLGTVPSHSWDWPALPQINEVDTANARKTNIATGVSNVPRIQAEDGYDCEAELAKEADYYGVTVAEMRAKHFAADFAQPGGQPTDSAASQADSKTPAPGGAKPVSRFSPNGRSKIPV